MTTAFIFPGQGAQQVGMLADLAEASPAGRRVFDAADRQLGFSLSQLCFAGPEERLNATDISQPAMFVCAVAALEAMKEALDGRMPAPAMTAGLSLGEYTALYAAGAIDFEAALDLVAKRGRFMQEASEQAPSGMVAVVGLDEAKVMELCAQAAQGAVLVPANFNCPGQVVISGDLQACARAVELAPKLGASAAIPLKVAGAFHSPFMQGAADKLAAEIAKVTIRPPTVPVVSNVDAAAHGDAESIKAKLVRQVTAPVRWADSIGAMLAQGAGPFYEIGPGRVLAGFMRRIDRKATVKCVNSADSLAKLAGELA